MDRKELITSNVYHRETKSIEYWRSHKEDIQEKNSQICDAFESGWDSCLEYISEKAKKLLKGEYYDINPKTPEEFLKELLK